MPLVALLLARSFALPPEWTRSIQAGSTVYRLQLPTGSAGIVVGPAQAPAPDARTYFSRKMASVLKVATPPILLKGGRLYATTESGGLHRSFTLLPKGDRVRFVGLIANGEAALAEIVGLPAGGAIKAGSKAPAGGSSVVKGTPSGPLPAASLGGAKVYVRYHYIGGAATA